MTRRLLRPAVLIPAFVVLALGAGIAYAAWQQLDPRRAEANEAVLDSLPLYPGAREIQRITQTQTGEDALPIPDEIITSALYAPPRSATQEDVVAFYAEQLQPEWKPRTRVVKASGDVGRGLGAELLSCGLLARRRLPQPAHVRHGPGARRRPDLRPVRADRQRSLPGAGVGLKPAASLPMRRAG